MHTNEPNYYDIWQVSPDADQGVVAAAYRRLARQYHPDLNKDPAGVVRMKELNVAFEVLGDPARRAAYDARRLGWAFAQPVGKPRTPGGYSGSRAVGVMLCLIVSLAIGIPTAMVVIRGAMGGSAEAAVTTTSPQPIFDPATSNCMNEPPISVDRTWLTSATNDQSGPILPLDTVQIGLRDEYGSPMESLSTSARVIGPDGSSFEAAKTLNGESWTYVRYPTDFTGAPALQTGAYTVIWEMAGGFVACDGFNVGAN